MRNLFEKRKKRINFDRILLMILISIIGIKNVFRLETKINAWKANREIDKLLKKEKRRNK